MSDENQVQGPLEDPKPDIEKECEESHHCEPFKIRLESCTEKIEGGKGAEEETCVEEFFDMMECISHCAAPKLFAQLK